MNLYAQLLQLAQQPFVNNAQMLGARDGLTTQVIQDTLLQQCADIRQDMPCETYVSQLG